MSAATDARGGPSAPRPLTAAEAKALGHPTRLKILFACRDRDLTNKDLAVLLGTTPGTIHYHLRPLLAEGLLAPGASRPGPRGSREQPYRATGRSLELAIDERATGALQAVAAEELKATGTDGVLELARIGLSLTEADLADLLQRLAAVVDEAVAASRRRSDGGDPASGDGPASREEVLRYTLLLAVTREAGDQETAS